MNVKMLLLSCLLFPLQIQAQDTTDVTQLRALSYMQFADQVQCDDPTDNLSQRICLNKELQELDAQLNELLLAYWNTLTVDSLLEAEQNYHEHWLIHRRLNSHSAAEGYRGHLLGIIYLHTMNEITRRRIEELVFLLGSD